MVLLDLVDEFVADRQKLALDLQHVLDGYAKLTRVRQRSDADLDERLLAGADVVELQSKIEALGTRFVKCEREALAVRTQVTTSLRSRVSRMKAGASRETKLTQTVGRLLERAATRLAPLADAGLLGGRHGVREHLADIIDERSMDRSDIMVAIERGFRARASRNAGTTTALVREQHRLCEENRIAHTEYSRRTRWLGPASAGDMEGAILLHPTVADFEQKWAVMVDVVIDSGGSAQVSSIVDDFFAVAIQQLSVEAARRIFRRLHRLQDRYLLIDRRGTARGYKGALGAVLDPGPMEKHRPFTLEAGDEIDDPIIVKHCANTRPPAFRSALIEMDPKLARARGIDAGSIGRRAARPIGDSGKVMEKWEERLEKVRRRWSSLQPVLLPDTDVRRRLQARPIRPK